MKSLAAGPAQSDCWMLTTDLRAKVCGTQLPQIVDQDCKISGASIPSTALSRLATARDAPLTTGDDIVRRHDRRALWLDLIRRQRPFLEAVGDALALQVLLNQAIDAVLVTDGVERAGDSPPLFSSDPAAHGISLAADWV